MIPEVTRHYVEVRGQRVHYRRRGSGPAVVMLHESPRSSEALLALMAHGPANVTMLAFDTPGCGNSEPLPLPRLEAADYADFLADTLAALGVERAVVYGTHTGAAIAMALAVRHPQRVARLVIDGIGVFNAAERAEILASYLPSFVPATDGSHLAWLWSRLRDQMLFFPWNHRGSGARLWRDMPDAAALHGRALDFLRAGDHYRAPYAAAFRYQPPAWMDRLRVPVFIGARQDDMLLPHLARLGEVPGNVWLEELPSDRSAAATRLWAQLDQGTEGLAPAPAPAPAPLVADRVANAYLDIPGGRLHVRGAMGGTGRPLVLLHDSPGGARGLDPQTRAVLGQRPVLAPDLPAHGDSPMLARARNARGIAAVLHAALTAMGLGDADVQGFGFGGGVAAALAKLHPRRYANVAPPVATHPGAAPAYNAPRPDGGHLLAAWFHARDEAILGPWWSRAADTRHDFGDDIDLDNVHARTIDMLKEAPQAAAMRAAWALNRTRSGPANPLPRPADRSPG